VVNIRQVSLSQFHLVIHYQLFEASLSPSNCFSISFFNIVHASGVASGLVNEFVLDNV
jgi:hypothetical protein